ncbi:Bug family tripartite tricarboxylate transporter substrate binding protein [Cupriavidus basilensis]|uniref:Bug family tripartite tricarboxylate transporter substrate binding protein n=1 Tax=Cupriavidus basilensis TaxID=68895 RepID=UPI000750DC9A|nr:tripartite tricarboxylate transporter substrate binding protein [Cupriavidus basilensis]
MYIKTLLAAAAAIALAAPPLAAAQGTAQDFPRKPIRIIVPYVAGGSTDLLARLVGQKLTEKWGQPVVVENRPGANGMVGTEFVAKAPPDGYTLGIASPGTHAANASLYKNVPYDTVRDFTPVTLAVNAPMLLVANPQLKVKSVRELIALAKAHPDSISYASGGSGSSQHLAMEQFMYMAGIKMVHVPYKGSSNSYTDLLGGRVSVEFDVLPTATPHTRSGKLLALATAADKPLPQMPDVPTVASAGVPGFTASSWYGFVGPAGMPKDILAKLNTEIVAALRQPSSVETLEKAGLQVVAGTPEQFAAHIRSEMDKAARIIAEAHIQPD